MTLPTKAVLLDIRSFLADNNIRRSTAAFSVNYGSDSGDVSSSAFTIGPTLSKTIASQLSPCVVTVLRTSLPLTVEITVRPPDVLLPPTVFTVVVSKMMILDSDIVTLSFTNPNATETAKVTLQQG